MAAHTKHIMPSVSARRRLMFLSIGSPLFNLLMDWLDGRSHCPGYDLSMTSRLAGALYFTSLPVTQLFVTDNKIFQFRAFPPDLASCGSANGGKNYLELRALAVVAFGLLASAPEELRAMS